ncbi:MAG: ABC transporter permease [Planctomycetaceae bacterium]|nr:ABC transporter permease [Planctomycetaceae bacterium]
MASVSLKDSEANCIHRLGERTIAAVESVGDLMLFTLKTLRWMFHRRPSASALTENMFEIGVRSIPVVVITGGFIGMVLAVNSYNQFSQMGMETRLGAVINISLVQELGPVLAATMLAGRVGSAMAAQLGTMKVTEQIDALWALGAEPIHYLVVPRFLACFLLIPMLTALADGIGILTGWLLSTQVLEINSFHYWFHAEKYVMPYDIMSGLVKSVFFGAAIAMIACHRGFRCGAGAEGVGRASTEAFVASFVAILALDFFLGVFLTRLYYVLWPGSLSLV